MRLTIDDVLEDLIHSPPACPYCIGNGKCISSYRPVGTHMWFTCIKCRSLYTIDVPSGKIIRQWQAPEGSR